MTPWLGSSLSGHLGCLPVRMLSVRWLDSAGAAPGVCRARTLADYLTWASILGTHALPPGPAASSPSASSGWTPCCSATCQRSPVGSRPVGRNRVRDRRGCSAQAQCAAAAGALTGSGSNVSLKRLSNQRNRRMAGTWRGLPGRRRTGAGVYDADAGVRRARARVRAAGGVPGGADGSLTPRLYPYRDYLEHLRGLGIKRHVLVAPSCYGTDNRCLLDALRSAVPGTGRGIVIADLDQVSDAELADWHALGVRGFRLQMHTMSPDREEIRAWVAGIGRYAAVAARLAGCWTSCPRLGSPGNASRAPRA